jgi:pimeloyl-ACP methyl ester carboxylesterase
MNEKASWRSPALGEARDIDLSQGVLRAHETGQGEPIVFVHGLLVNANLWRKVVPSLAGDFRCVSLDMPLGSHLRPMPKDADLSPYALADLVADAIEKLGLENVTLVGNDTGGAISQIVATRRPERIGRLVLTPCDAFDNFPPSIFKWALAPAKLPALVPLVFGPLRMRAPRRAPFAFGWLTERPIDRDAEDSYVLPPLSDKGARRDVAKVLRGVDPKYTLEAAERLREFRSPTLFAWASEDRFFKPAHAERLAKIIPDARVEWIDDSYSFVPEDQPGRLAELIAGFVREPRKEPSGTAS